MPERDPNWRTESTPGRGGEWVHRAFEGVDDSLVAFPQAVPPAEDHLRKWDQHEVFDEIAGCQARGDRREGAATATPYPSRRLLIVALLAAVWGFGLGLLLGVLLTRGGAL